MALMEAPRSVVLGPTVVRPATVADVGALHRMEASAVSAGRALVVVRDGEVLGGVGLSPTTEPSVAEVTDLYVRPDQRGHGLARMLLRGACANIVAQGSLSAVAWVAPGDGRARRLLESSGWRPDRSSDTPWSAYRRSVLTPARLSRG